VEGCGRPWGSERGGENEVAVSRGLVRQVRVWQGRFGEGRVGRGTTEGGQARGG